IPDRSTLGPLPVRLRGVVATPAGSGRHPLVLVLHGRHPDGCPAGPFDSETWPCFAAQRRYDHGLRHIAIAIAERGMIAAVPDVAGAFTGGWGEPDDVRRWPRIVDRTLRALAGAAVQRSDPPPFGVDLTGRIDLRRIGVLGHSRSGGNAVRAARTRTTTVRRSAAQVTAGRGPWRSLLLLAPTGDGGRVPDVPTTVVLSSCDGDVGDEGLAYLRSARRRPQRRHPLLLTALQGANHNFFNRTLARARFDDAPRGARGCRSGDRLRAAQQQRWIARVAAAHFAVTLRGVGRPAWLRRTGRRPTRIYGLSVTSRWAPRIEE
ncbi:MAG: hypothetical protein AB7G37_20480, partial [Solirubrobacteraceae bacterium]